MNECPCCGGLVDGSLDVHLESCPMFEPWRPLTVDEMLDRLGSLFRVGSGVES